MIILKSVSTVFSCPTLITSQLSSNKVVKSVTRLCRIKPPNVEVTVEVY